MDIFDIIVGFCVGYWLGKISCIIYLIKTN